MPRKSPMTASEVGIKHGFRSGLEEQVAEQLRSLGIPVHYESVKVKYKKPEKSCSYKPDFPLPNGIIIETKGRFLTEDRQKHLLIKDQHPELDIRFVFSNSKARISKTSATTYADWCRSKGFKFADKYIPLAWIEERGTA